MNDVRGTAHEWKDMTKKQGRMAAQNAACWPLRAGTGSGRLVAGRASFERRRREALRHRGQRQVWPRERRTGSGRPGSRCTIRTRSGRNFRPTSLNRRTIEADTDPASCSLTHGTATTVCRAVEPDPREVTVHLQISRTCRGTDRPAPARAANQRRRRGSAPSVSRQAAAPAPAGTPRRTHWTIHLSSVVASSALSSRSCRALANTVRRLSSTVQLAALERAAWLARPGFPGPANLRQPGGKPPGDDCLCHPVADGWHTEVADPAAPGHFQGHRTGGGK